MGRLKGAGLYHHIYAWGNDRHPIFKADAHRLTYLRYAELSYVRHKIDIIAYALMEWHVHLFVFDRVGRLSQFIEHLHGRYARYFNRMTGRIGHVFGKRFGNKIVQADNYGLWLSRYIHRQPVEAGLVKEAKDYPWTSYQRYLGLQPLGFIKHQVIIDQFGGGRRSSRIDYEEFVSSTEIDSVDWTDPRVTVVGDSRFCRMVEKSLDEDGRSDDSGPIEATSTPADDTTILRVADMVSRRLGVEFSVLLRPQGRSDRSTRHKAFMIMAGEYGLSLRRIARLFGVSQAAVSKAIRARSISE